MNEYARIISQNLKRIAYESGKTQAEIARDLKINKSSLSLWMNGERIPRMSKIDMLCKYFNVNRSDIMDEKPQDHIDNYYPISEEEKRIILAYRLANTNTKDIVCKILDVKRNDSAFSTEAG